LTSGRWEFSRSRRQESSPEDQSTLLFTIPAHCFSPDCHYKITADASNEVDESDEANNSAASVCLG
jgi:hypothetical protein